MPSVDIICSISNAKLHTFLREYKLEIIGFLLYLILFSYTIYSHEPWRDEYQAWDIARNSQTLAQLNTNLEYEGQPGLWHLLLFFASKITRDFWIVKIVHGVFAVACVYLILFKSQIEKYTKLLIPFGYFILYEYSAISRNYILCLLLALGLAMLLNNRKWLKLSLVGFLLCLTGVYGIILTVAFATTIFLFNLKPKFNILIALSILLTGIGVGLVLIMPAKDFSRNVPFDTTLNIEKIKSSVDTVWDAYIPIFKNQINYWNNNILEPYYLKFKPSVFLLLFSLFCFVYYKNYQAATFYVIATFGLLLFNYTQFDGVIRHDGWLFIVFLLSYILSKNRGTILTTFAFVIFSIHAYSGIKAATFDWKNIFTSDQIVAQKISEIPNHLIVADDDSKVSGVVMSLDEKAYYPKTDRWGSYIIWDNLQNDTIFDPIKTVGVAFDLQAKNPAKSVVLLTTYKLDNDKLVFMYENQPAITTQKGIWVYTVKR